MRKFLLAILIVTCACQRTQKFEGIWEATSIIGRGRPFTPTERLFEFLADSVNIVQFGDPQSGKFDTLIISAFAARYQDSTITLTANEEQFTLLFFTISADSLVFADKEDSNTRTTLKKLKRGTNFTVTQADLIGHSFEVNSRDYIHKMDFVSDSIVFDGGYYDEDQWEIVTYKGFRFLNTTSYLFDIRPISKLDDGTIVLTGNTTDTATSMKKLTPVRSKKELIGHWKEVSRTPRPSSVLHVDDLRITQDSIFITSGSSVEQLSYGLSSDGQFIYFPSRGSRTYSGSRKVTPWNIIMLNSEELVVQMVDKGDTTTTRYKSW